MHLFAMFRLFSLVWLFWAAVPAGAAEIGLNAAFSFDEGTGTSAGDVSGKGNNDTFMNGASWSTGKFGSGLLLDGVNDHVSVPDSASLDLGSSGTVELWFKLSALNTWRSLVSKGNSNSFAQSNYFIEFQPDNRIVYGFGNGNIANEPVSSFAVTDTAAFHHLALTWDGTNLRLYFDGALRETRSQTISPAANVGPLLIGYFGGNVDPFKGLIDELRIYDRALSLAEIQTDMNSPIGGSAPPDLTAPVISSVTADGLSANSATIRWNTDELSDSQVEYGLTDSYGNLTALNGALVTAHAQTLAGLAAGRLYHYRVKSRDAAGNGASSADFTFMTSAGGFDTTNAFKKMVVGPGTIDASVRQVVRTPGGQIYVFSADDTAQKQGTGPGVIRAYKGNQAGIPTAFAEMNGANRPSASGSGNVLGSPDVRLDLNGTVHLAYVNSSNRSLVYRTFSTPADVWGPSEVVAGNVTSPGDFHFFKRAQTANALILDANEKPHLVYMSGSAVFYTNKVSGTWSAPQSVAAASSGLSPLHPQLAYDAGGNIHLAWLEDGSSHLIKHKKRLSDGMWTATETVESADVLGNFNLDQGPSLVLNNAGVPYVMYLSETASAVRVKYKSGTNWVADHPAANLYAHTPQIYGQNDDIYVFLGHDINVNYGYAYRLSGQGWSPYKKLSTDTDDGSASIRWDPMRETNPGIIDTAFFDEDKLGNSSFLGEVYYMAVTPSGTPPPPGDTVPPSVSITAPASGSTVSATVSITAGASDNVAVANVQFKLDGADLGLADAAAPYSISWDSTRVANGSHTLTAVATDTSGNQTPSSAVLLFVNNTTSLTISGPAVGAITSNSATVNWATNLPADSQVEYGLTSAYGNSTPLNPALQTAHSQALTALAANTLYHYRVLSKDASGSLATSGDFTFQTLTTGLVAAYSFDEGSGTRVIDRSGNANNGVISGAAWTTGKFGTALSFNGANNWVTIADAASLDLSNGMTLEAWVRPVSLYGWRTVVIKELTAELVYSLYANTDRNVPGGYIFTNGAERSTLGVSPIPLNAWTHLAATYNGASFRLYVNGVLARTAATTGSMPNSTRPLRIGGNSVWGEWFNGRIDEVRIYNRPLSQSEIQTDMNTGIPPASAAPVLAALNEGVAEPALSKNLLHPVPADAAERIDSTFTLGEVYVYPSPAVNKKLVTLHIEAGLADQVNLKIYNIIGEKIVETTLVQPPTVILGKYAYEYPFPLSGVPSGLYIYTVEARKQGAGPVKKTGKFAVVK